ncbi:hypothetical protein GCM10027037_03060 [Mucilaginibacter koreensis]
MAEENIVPSDLYTISRSQIQSYDAGLGPRLLWMANGQAFAFGIYCGLTFAMPPSPDLTNRAQIFGGVIPFVGAIVSIFTLLDIITSLVQMHKLASNYKKANNGLESEASFPMLDATFADRLFQRISPLATTLLFIIIWTFLILYDHKLI